MTATRWLLIAVALTGAAIFSVLLFWFIRAMADAIPNPTTFVGFLVRQPDHHVTACGRLPLIVPYANNPTKFDLAMDPGPGIDWLYSRGFYCPEAGNAVGLPSRPFWAMPIELITRPTGAPFNLRGAR